MDSILSLVKEVGPYATIAIIAMLWLMQRSRSESKIAELRIEMERTSEDRAAQTDSEFRKMLGEQLMEKQISINDLQERFDDYQTAKNNEVTALKDTVQTLTDNVGTLENRVDSLTRDLEQEKRLRLAAEQKANRLEARQSELENINSRLVQDNAHLIKSKEQLSNRVLEMQIDNDRLRTENASLRAQVATKATGEVPAVPAPPPQN